MAFQNTTNDIPFFVQNQILRASDLNKLVDAIQERIRVSTAATMGIGIIFGLEICWATEDGSTVVKVTPGQGLSSDGYEFSLSEDCIFRSYRERTLSGDAFDCDRRDKCNSDKNLLAGPIYELSTDAIEVAQLSGDTWFTVPTLSPEEQGIEGKDPFAWHCGILLYCEETESDVSCFSDCEAVGSNIKGAIKLLLLPQAVYEDRFKTTDGEEPIGIDVELPTTPKIARIGIPSDGTGDKIDLCRIQTETQLQEAYRRVCTDAIADIADAYQASYLEFYQHAVGSPGSSFANLQSQLETRFNGLSRVIDLQYFYTHLQELILAYEAFSMVANGQTFADTQVTGESLNRCLFPGHIALGWIKPVNGFRVREVDLNGDGEPEVLQNCRTPRILPDTFPEKQSLFEDAICLFERMQALVDGLQLPASHGDIRLTPGQRFHPYLEGRALPFYYLAQTKDKWWVNDYPARLKHQFTACDQDHPLLCDLVPYDFYRVEGYADEELETVLVQMDTLRQDLNIAFDVRCVIVGEDFVASDEIFVAEDLEDQYLVLRSELLCKLDELRRNEQGQGWIFPSALIQAEQLYDELLLKTHLHRFPAPNFVPGEICCDYDVEEQAYLDDWLGIYGEAVGAIQTYTRNNDGEYSRLDPKLGEEIKQLALRYHKRKYEADQQKKFSCFAHEHPGLEHLGGVPRAGTLVLVYKEVLNRQGLILSLREREVQSPDGRPLNALSDEELIALAKDTNIRLAPFSTETVIADFCLPYLCCSESIVVRNEIQRVQAAINLTERDVCFDANAESNAIDIGLSPQGGTLRIVTADGESLEFANVGEEQIIELNDWSEFVSNFASQGMQSLQLNYSLAEGGTVQASINIYLRPELDCDNFSIASEFSYGGKCGINGFLVSLNAAAPLDLSRFGTFTVDLLTPSGSVTNLIAEADSPFRGIDRIALEEPGVHRVRLTATNGPCPAALCEIPLDPCPDTANFVEYRWFSWDGEAQDVNIIPFAGEATLLRIPLDTIDPGFIMLRIQPTGLELRASLVNATDATEYDLVFFQIERPPAPEVLDCSEHQWYTVIYNQQKALEFLSTLVTAEQPVPFTDTAVRSVSMADANGSVFDTPDQDFTLRLAYYSNLEACPREVPLATHTLNIVNPSRGRGGKRGDPNELKPAPSPKTIRPNVQKTAKSRAIPVAADAAQLLNKRQASYGETLNQVREKHADVAKTAGFKRASLFVFKQGDAAALNAEYATTARSLLSSFSRTTDKQRKDVIEEVILATTHAWLDKLAAQSEPEEETLAAIQTQMAKLKAAGLSVTKLKRNWKASDLRKALPKAQVNLIHKQLKA